MEVQLMLTVRCEECKTEFVPDYVKHGPADVDRDSDGVRGRIMYVRFVPTCPACNAVRSLLNRAGVRSIAAELIR